MLSKKALTKWILIFMINLTGSGGLAQNWIEL